MVEEGLSLLKGSRTDQALELLYRGQEVRGWRISSRVESWHHVGETRGRDGQEPRAGEINIEAKVWVLELLGGDCGRLGLLVLVAVTRVQEIKESRTVRSQLRARPRHLFLSGLCGPRNFPGRFLLTSWGS